MKLKTKSDYTTPESRKRLVDFLSVTIEGRKDDSFSPYKPNDSDDMYWTLDSGNNWKVKFNPDEPNVFEICYRYSSCSYEQALAGWLVVRIGAEIVK